MANKYLDKENGLPALWAKIKEYFVQKETGKGLSTNDYTSAEKTKLSGIATGATKNTIDTAMSDTSTNGVQNKVIKAYADNINTTLTSSISTINTKLNGIETGAEVNVIESVKVNGTALTVTSKSVDVTVPTKTSDLTNDSDYQTSTQVTTSIENAVPTKTSELTNDSDYQTSTQATNAINATVSSAVTYKGSLTSANLPTSGQSVGDMYNLTDDSNYGPAGMNVIWNGTDWDAAGSTLSVESITAEEVAEICTV